MEDLVRSNGYDCALFSSAEDFLANSQPETINCLIVDIQMPGLSGLELQDELRRCGNETPLIFLTSYRDASIRDAAVRRGAFAYLTKPAAFQQVMDTLEQALART